MRLERTRQRIRIVRNALAALATTYRRDRDLVGMAGRAWAVASREGLRGVKARMLRATYPPDAPPPPPPPLGYEEWVGRFDSLGPAEVEAARRHAATLDLPEVLILHLAGREDAASLARSVASWRESVHPAWRAAVVAAPNLPGPTREAARAAVAAEPRAAVVETAEALRAVLLERRGPALLCLGGVLLNPLSAYMFAEAAARSGAEVAYADHDRVDGAGRRADPAFKPQFSPGYAARHNYLGDCVLLAPSVPLRAEDLLGATTPEGFDRLVSDLAAGRRVEHLPFVLSHVTRERPRPVRAVPPPDTSGPSVGIVIPTRDGVGHLRACLESIAAATAYDRALVEVVVVDNDSRDPATLAYLEALARDGAATVVRYPHPFNFAAINNAGAAASRGEILVFLNDDTVVRDPHWLGKLVAQARRPETGAVGAKLLFPDGTIQHGGCAAGANMGTVRHLLLHAAPAAVEATDHTREMSVMTGACLAVRREVFERVGGFDPVLRVTWNDAKFCLACLEAGYRNVYVADPLLVHDESKTRSPDDDRAKMARYAGEAAYARAHLRRWFADDPSFSPNLSAEYGGGLAAPPRVRRPWSRPPGRAPRVMVLSSVYRFGFGVPLVIQQQARKLVERGHEVIVAGPAAEREFAFPGCERVVLDTPRRAAVHAFEADVSLVVAHTPPFFELPALLGPHIPVLAYDYGEPAAEFFPEPTRSYLLDVEFQKRLAAPMTAAIAAISQAVKDETLNAGAAVVGLANSHLPAWSEATRPRREEARRRLGWEGRFVVLTVCRFSQNERAYKGLDKVAAVLREFSYLHTRLAGDVVFALAGAGSAEDVERVRALGFSVHPNVPDEELADLYAAADAYMSLSRWEGYNLGVAQALAMGLPVAASDIPAHREFPVFTSNSVLVLCGWLAREVERGGGEGRERRAVVYDWEESTTRFAALVEEVIRAGDAREPRLGASAARPRPEDAAGCSGAVRPRSEARAPQAPRGASPSAGAWRTP